MSTWVARADDQRGLWARPGFVTLMLWLAGIVGLAGFFWPVVTQTFSQPVRDAAPLLAIAVTVTVAVLALVALNAGMSGARTVALLGTLIALGMVLRFLGVGFGGFEPVFVLPLQKLSLPLRQRCRLPQDLTLPDLILLVGRLRKWFLPTSIAQRRQALRSPLR